MLDPSRLYEVSYGLLSIFILYKFILQAYHQNIYPNLTYLKYLCKIINNLSSLNYFYPQKNPAMTLMQDFIKEVRNNAFEYFSSINAFLINNGLQTLFFTMAIIQVIFWTLKKINLFFADDFGKSNGVVKILIFILFSYIKVWDKFAVYLEILGYFCSVSICLNLYSGCLRLGQHITRLNKYSFGNILTLLSISLVYFSYKIFTVSQPQQQKAANYPYVSLYFLILGGMFLISILRKKHIIYFLIIMNLIGLIVILRYWSDMIMSETFLSKSAIPLQSIPYVIWAVQQSFLLNQEQRQLIIVQGQIQNQDQQERRPCQLFLAQTYYFLFFLINKRMYSIELVFASISLVSYLAFKQNQ